LHITHDIQLLTTFYQRLLDSAARADGEEGIRQGLAEVARGRTRPAREAFDSSAENMT